MKYLVYRINEKAQLEVAGIYDKNSDAEERLYYVEDNFTSDGGIWLMEPIPNMDIELGSVLLLSKKD